MTVKLTITTTDKLKNEQKRYAKYLQWGDSFGIALQEITEGAGQVASSDVDFSCVIQNKDGDIILQNRMDQGILLNGKVIETKAPISNGDMLALNQHILLNIKIYELTGKDLFRSTRSSKDPIIIKIPVVEKKEVQEDVDISNPVGRVIDGYYIEKVLKYGSMGIIYKGIQQSLNRPVAIKTVAPKNLNNPTLLKRFMNMANLAWRLNHPYIVQIYDTGMSHEFRSHYVVMEHIEGDTLNEVLVNKKKLDIEEACNIMGQLASALSFAHRQNIIHRNVNPTNIIMTKNGYLKLIGLALSKIVDPDEENLYLTQAGQAMGTIGYISPEQARSAADVDYRTDLYSLGVIFYECLCGCLPFDEKTLNDPNKYMKALKQRPKNPPHQVNPAVPESLSQIVMRCLEPLASKRYQKAEEILQDIKVYTESMQLSVAQKRIRAMFPKTPVVEGFDFHVTFEPMEGIGGDFYDFVMLDNNRIGIVIGDVTGHGVEAAVVMGMVKSIVKLMSKNLDSASDILEYSNRELSPDMDSTTFTTIGCGILNTKDKTFSYARAGHNPLLLYNPNRDPRLTSLSPKGTILGVPWSLNCQETKIHLMPGDILIQYTDGFTEAQSKEGEEFGFERLCETIEMSGASEVKEVVAAIRTTVDTFAKDSTEDADDLTLLAFKMH